MPAGFSERVAKGRAERSGQDVSGPKQAGSGKFGQIASRREQHEQAGEDKRPAFKAETSGSRGEVTQRRPRVLVTRIVVQ